MASRPGGGGGGGGSGGGGSLKVKVVLLGEGRVGKTSIVLRYVENKFNDKHYQTLQVRGSSGHGLDWSQWSLRQFVIIIRLISMNVPYHCAGL